MRAKCRWIHGWLAHQQLVYVTVVDSSTSAANAHQIGEQKPVETVRRTQRESDTKKRFKEGFRGRSRSTDLGDFVHEIGGGLLLAEDIDEAAHDKKHARSGGAIAHCSQEAQDH